MDARRWLAGLVLALGGIVGLVAWHWRASEAGETPRSPDSPDVRSARPNLDEPQLELSSVRADSANARDAQGVENGITGRVVSAADGAGLGGFWIKLFDGGAQIADTNSDELGWFRLPPPPEPRGRVIVSPAWSWTVLEATQTVEWREDQQYEPLRFRARPANVAKLRAQLFDDTTGEVVPYYLVDIATRESGHEQRLTDEQGVFETNSAYAEGWALYAESLGGQLGLYKDPYDRFGRLASERFRAVRLVVDTGIHSMGWTREQAIAFFKEHAPQVSLAEVDRYISWPAQALAYKMGQLRIMELRKQAEQKLGPKFDIREFHDVVLRDGALPLELLQEQGQKYINAN